MKALPKRKSNLWGQEYDVKPMLLDLVIGDGKEFIWFEHMDDRPWYYVIRVNSGTREHIKKATDELHDCILPSIESAIDEESMDFYSNRQWNEYDKKGYVSETRKWPIPPDFPAGSAWGTYSPTEADLKVIGYKNPRSSVKSSVKS